MSFKRGDEVLYISQCSDHEYSPLIVGISRGRFVRYSDGVLDSLIEWDIDTIDQGGDYEDEGEGRFSWFVQTDNIELYSTEAHPPHYKVIRKIKQIAERRAKLGYKDYSSPIVTT